MGCCNGIDVILLLQAGDRTVPKPMTIYTITVEGTTHTMKSKVADYAYATGMIIEGTVHKPGFSRKLEAVMKTAQEIRAYNNGSIPYVVELATGKRLV